MVLSLDDEDSPLALGNCGVSGIVIFVGVCKSTMMLGRGTGTGSIGIIRSALSPSVSRGRFSVDSLMSLIRNNAEVEEEEEEVGPVDIIL